MYIWYTAPLAKINYLDFTMIVAFMAAPHIMKYNKDDS